MISGLSLSHKEQLLKWLEKEVGSNYPGVEKSDNLMGGVACLRETRIPVWLLEQARRLGSSEADLLRNYPQLTAADLQNAWDYVAGHRREIEDSISENERVN
jgi:uncharacterized protein (DUF433 family)